MNPNYSHIYDRFVGGQSPREFTANSSHESIADAVAEYIRDMPAEWTEDEDMEEVADALVSYITDALTVDAQRAVDAWTSRTMTRTELIQSLADTYREVLRVAAMLARREFTPSEFPGDWPKRPTGSSVARTCAEHSEKSRLASIRLRKALDSLNVLGFHR